MSFVHFFRRLFGLPAHAEAAPARPVTRVTVLRPPPRPLGSDEPATPPEPEPAKDVDPPHAPTVAAYTNRLLDELGGDGPAPTPFPVTALRLSVILQKAEPDLNQLIKLVGQDPTVSAKVLQVANSALYAPAVPVESLRDAVNQMGTRTVVQVALGEASRALYDTKQRDLAETVKLVSARLFHDAMTAAYAAGLLSMQLRKGQLDRAFLGGILHDIGKAAALRRLLEMPDASGHLYHPSTLDAILEGVHLEMGCDLLRRWELPDGIVELCAHHHDDDLGPEWEDLHVVRVASGLVQTVRGTASPELRAQVRQSIAALGMDAGRGRVLMNDVRAQSKIVQQTFGLDPAVALPETTGDGSGRAPAAGRRPAR